MSPIDVEYDVKPFEFNIEQLSELLDTARELVVSNIHDQHIFVSDYPRVPSEQEIQSEFESLKAKAQRFIMGNADLDQEYINFTEHKRMIYLECCKTFNIWKDDNCEPIDVDLWLK